MGRFYVDDEGGMAVIYQVVHRGRLVVAKDGVMLPVRLVGYVEARDTSGIPSFEEFVTRGSRAPHAAAA